MIQALIPLGLRAVEDALLAEVQGLAGPRYSRDDGEPDLVRWGAQRGSIYLADQKLQISVPRVRDRRNAVEAEYNVRRKVLKKSSKQETPPDDIDQQTKLEQS